MKYKFLLMCSGTTQESFATLHEAQEHLKDALENCDQPDDWSIAQIVEYWQCVHRGGQSFYHERIEPEKQEHKSEGPQ